MAVKMEKNSKEILSKAQKRLLKDSLRKLLGSGLLDTPQRGQHEIHPYVLKGAINIQQLK